METVKNIEEKESPSVIQKLIKKNKVNLFDCSRGTKLYNFARRYCEFVGSHKENFSSLRHH